MHCFPRHGLGEAEIVYCLFGMYAVCVVELRVDILVGPEYSTCILAVCDVMTFFSRRRTPMHDFFPNCSPTARGKLCYTDEHRVRKAYASLQKESQSLGVQLSRAAQTADLFCSTSKHVPFGRATQVFFFPSPTDCLHPLVPKNQQATSEEILGVWEPRVMADAVRLRTSPSCSS